MKAKKIKKMIKLIINNKNKRQIKINNNKNN